MPWIKQVVLLMQMDQNLHRAHTARGPSSPWEKIWPHHGGFWSTSVCVWWSHRTDITQWTALVGFKQHIELKENRLWHKLVSDILRSINHGCTLDMNLKEWREVHCLYKSCLYCVGWLCVAAMTWTHRHGLSLTHHKTARYGYIWILWDLDITVIHIWHWRLKPNLFCLNLDWSRSY